MFGPQKGSVNFRFLRTFAAQTYSKLTGVPPARQVAQPFNDSHYSAGTPRGTPYSGLYGEAPPERDACFKLAVYKRVGKTAILVYERVTKSAAK